MSDVKPDPDSQHPDYRESRFTWNKGDLVFIKTNPGPPLLTPEELQAAIRHNEPARLAHRERASNVDYPAGEDIDYPDKPKTGG